jgi:hypothetical protein
MIILQQGMMKMIRKNTYHTHTDGYGFVHKCYHKTKAMFLDVTFWVGTVIAFPLEHWLYEKGPLHFVSVWLGL